MNRVKKRLAYLLAAVLLFALIVPAAPDVTAYAATKNPITELGIEKLPEGNAIPVGDVFNFNPDIIETELGKGKTTGKVWWEINTKTNTAGVSSSRWGYVYPLYEGSFEIRALAFANTKDMNAWKAARSANGKVADEAATAKYVTAMTDWVTIDVVSDTEGYAVARTQYQLGLVLKNTKATDVHIKTDNEVSFTIAAKNYTKRTLTIDAPNAEVENAGRFAQINIKQIKASTFTEKAYGNRFYVTAPDARIVFLGNARTSEVVFEPEKTAETKQLTLVGEGGTLSTLNIEAAGKVDIIGNIFADRTGKAVVVNVAEEAEGTSIQTAAALEVNAAADVAVTVDKAEGSENAQDTPKTVINMEKAAKVSVDGTAADGTTVVVKGEAKGSEVASNAALVIVADADVVLKLTKNAAGTSVTKGENVKVELSAESTVDGVSVTDVNGTVETIKPGEDSAEVTAAPSATPTPVPTTAPSGGSSSGGSTPSYPVTPSTPTPTSTPAPTATPMPSQTPEYFASYTLDGKTTEIKFNAYSERWYQANILLPAESASKTITIMVNGDSLERELQPYRNYVSYTTYDEKEYDIEFLVPLSSIPISASLSDIKISPSSVTGSAILNIKIDNDAPWQSNYYWEYFNTSYTWKQGDEVTKGKAFYQKEVEVAINGDVITYTEPEPYSLEMKVDFTDFGGEPYGKPGEEFFTLQSNELMVDISITREKITPIRDAEIGDTIIFGNYEQNGNMSDGVEDIEWVVLDIQGDKLLLLSKYALDDKDYNEVIDNSIKDFSWEICTLRTWLNEDFYNLAFTEKEKVCIETVTNKNYQQSYYNDGKVTAANDTEDRVFVLSLEEMQKYFPNQSDSLIGAKLTHYAQLQGGGREISGRYYGIGQWWLRTNDAAAEAWSVAPAGDTRTTWVDNSLYAVEEYHIVVRPTLWISISDAVQE